MTELAVYMNSSKGIDERVRDLLSRMTLREKLGQMLQMSVNDGTLQQFIGEMHVGSLFHIRTSQIVDAIELVAQTRLQIPLLFADDCIHGHGFAKGATVFPTQLAMACSWDRDLIEQVGRVTALEATATGLKWTFSPVLGVARDLRWGRVGETFGEDTFLAGEFGLSLIRGYQGKGLNDKTALLATAKHYAGYCETQGGRDASEADLTRRKLRSWFFPSFEKAARGGCMAFMTGYQAIDGVPSTASRWLLKEVLKEEWGFNGILVTDFDNVGRMYWEQQICPDMKDAATLAVKSGNDVMMATPSFIDGALEAVASGMLMESEIDEVVARILALKFNMGLFEDPCSPHSDGGAAILGCDAHRQVNLKMARESLVLLQNDGVLPLDATRPMKIAVLGPNADDPDAQLGDWAGASGQVPWMLDGQPRSLVTTVLDGFRMFEGDGLQVVYEKGAEIVDLDKETYGYFSVGGEFKSGKTQIGSTDDALVERAVAAARDADVAVAVVGDHFVLAGENCSTATLEMQGGQQKLLAALSACGTPLIVVLVNTKPLILPACIHHAAAIIEVFNPGMAGGQAVAEAIFGKFNPRGKLTVSIPYHVGQQPVYYNQVRGQHGNRYADMTQEPHFSFGHGMSYASLTYRNLTLETPTVRAGQLLKCNVEIENESDWDAVEIVQLYIHDNV
ncbi:MAG: glycoside hydrolase family 3 C-terminal domain-containing protein, partial [Deltaproteobacteria bacterium]|nr:glycoside hydrolase family 3 C-terminal domain-containing protein [Deltaproteobacteria bacterium]